MSDSLKEMMLMHMTLQPSSAMNLACYGNFSAQRAQEVAVVRGGGQWLTLLRPNEHTGKMDNIADANVFGVIRCMAAVRLARQGNTQTRRRALPRLVEAKACVAHGGSLLCACVCLQRILATTWCLAPTLVACQSCSGAWLRVGS